MRYNFPRLRAFAAARVSYPKTPVQGRDKKYVPKTRAGVKCGVFYG